MVVIMFVITLAKSIIISERCLQVFSSDLCEGTVHKALALPGGGGARKSALLSGTHRSKMKHVGVRG